MLPDNVLADETVVHFPVDLIIIPAERQRQQAAPDDALISSIQMHGLIQPIVVREDGTLVAGERRLRAHMQLELLTIRATIFEHLNPIKAFLIELAENLVRKQLTWQEEVHAVGKYHGMRLLAFPGWTNMGTATDLGRSDSWIGKVLAVYEEMKDENVNTCPTFNGAFNYITAKAQRARIAAHSRGLDVAVGASLILPPLVSANATKEERTAAFLSAINLGTAMEETLEDVDRSLSDIQAGKIAAAALEVQRKQDVVNDIILCDDFLNWAESYTGPKFDVIHFDPPYGKNYSGARTRKTAVHTSPIYADDPDIFFSLVDGFLNLQDSFTFQAAHCMIWFDMPYYTWLIERFSAAGWVAVQPYPLIWGKGYSGIASDVKRRPRHCYETALLFSRGDRKISKLDRDYTECALDAEKLHLNQKPLAMLSHFLRLIVDEHTAVLDPTCGSGTALAAAGNLGAARILGIELDPANAEVARFLLQRFHPEVTNVGQDVQPSLNLQPQDPSSAG